MTVERIVALLLALAVLVGIVRLLLWHRASGGTSTRWRLALLLLLQPLCAALLYAALFPPPVAGGSALLRVATAGAPRLAAAGPPLIVLPEAGALPGEAAPDLATALRRHPAARAIEVVGTGLVPRDVEAARGLVVRFRPGPLPAGVLDLAPPAPTAPGSTFTLGATIAGIADARAELIDPAGRVTDMGTPDADGIVRLTGTARGAGTADFLLRLRAGQHVVEEARVPVIVTDAAPPRLLILAGAPGAEVKYLRRWATDAGFAVATRISAGGGVTLGDGPVSLDGASLRRFDAVLVDDRGWATLGVGRAAVLGAVRDGLGLILRPGGPLDGATRAQWQALGFALRGSNDLAPLALPPAPAAAIARTRRGIAEADRPDDMALPDEVLPDVSRLAAVPSGRDTVTLLRDGGGTAIAAWRASGLGRIALFTAIDSYALTLTGNQPLHDQWWRALLAAVVRPAPAASAVAGIYWAGERMTLCDLTPPARVTGPDGRPARLIVAHGCAGYWPAAPGWHLLADARGARPFHVQPAAALPAMRTARDRDATRLLQGDTPANGAGEPVPGPSWPWWLGWLIASALLWWFERARFGRAQSAR